VSNANLGISEICNKKNLICMNPLFVHHLITRKTTLLAPNGLVFDEKGLVGVRADFRNAELMTLRQQIEAGTLCFENIRAQTLKYNHALEQMSLSEGAEAFDREFVVINFTQNIIEVSGCFGACLQSSGEFNIAECHGPVFYLEQDRESQDSWLLYTGIFDTNTPLAVYGGDETSTTVDSTKKLISWVRLANARIGRRSGDLRAEPAPN
jgi:hypothetical protein